MKTFLVRQLLDGIFQFLFIFRIECKHFDAGETGSENRQVSQVIQLEPLRCHRRADDYFRYEPRKCVFSVYE